MAKSPTFHENRIVESYYANADLSANRRKGVRLFTSNTVGVVPTSGADVIGIQENIPESQSSAAVRVCTGGPTLAVAGVAITVTEELIINANNTATGLVYPASSITSYGRTGTTHIIGHALESATEPSQVIAIFVNKHIDRLI